MKYANIYKIIQRIATILCNCQTFHILCNADIYRPQQRQYEDPYGAIVLYGTVYRCAPYRSQYRQFVSSVRFQGMLRTSFPQSTLCRPVSSQPDISPGAYFRRTCSGRTCDAYVCSRQSGAELGGRWHIPFPINFSLKS